MLTFRIPIDTTNSRHLYRHLLREASYLPPVARPWVVGQIRDRFRRHIDIPFEHGPKRAARRRDAYYFLRYIRGAVVGDANRMLRILFLVFGRKGRRRRELVSSLLLPINDAKNLQELDKLIASRKKDLPITSKWSRARHVSAIMDKWDIPILRALANSQVKQPDDVLGRLGNTAIKHVPPRYDKVNLWGKPHSERRKRYIEARHWKTIADRLLPPLEKKEWALLERLATENKAVDPLLKTPMKRRKVARSVRAQSEEQSWRNVAKSDKTRPYDWIDTVTTRVDMLERQRNRRNRVISGARRDGDPRGTAKPLAGSKPLSGRAMRRLILVVWQLSPMIVPQGSSGKFSIIWGGRDEKNRPEVKLPTVADLFFAGVDEEGKLSQDLSSGAEPP